MLESVVNCIPDLIPDLTKDKVIKIKDKKSYGVKHIKKFELTNSNIPLLFQSTHRGCAGTCRQLLSLKANDPIMDKVIKINRKHDISGIGG